MQVLGGGKLKISVVFNIDTEESYEQKQTNKIKGTMASN